jgi:hypothetical protein
VTFTPSETGSHTITATYSGGTLVGHGPGGSNVPINSSVGTFTLTVTGKHATTTMVGCSPATVPVGGTISCTATVTDVVVGAPATTPTGTVSFSTDSGSFSGGGSCTLSGSGPSASCSVSYTPTVVGPHTITATYGGDATHSGSSGTTVVTATLRLTSTTVICSPNPVIEDAPTTCTATVTDTDVGTKFTPTGTVAFTSSGVGTFTGNPCTLGGSGASASCSVTYAPAAGSAATSPHTITGIYSGDGLHFPSSGSTSLTVNPAPPGKVTGGGQIAVPGGRASFGFVVQQKTTGGLPVGQLEYLNHVSRLNVHSVTIISLFIDSTTNTATFSGTCISNGSPLCTFSVTVQDNGEPGSKSSPKDKFSIVVGGTALEVVFPPTDVQRGNIQIHR